MNYNNKEISTNQRLIINVKQYILVEKLLKNQKNIKIKILLN